MIYHRCLFTFRLVPVFAVLAGMALALRTQAAPPLVVTVLHTFGTGGHGGLNPSSEKNSDGARPEAPLMQGRDGALYGTAPTGGAHGTGVVFKINPDGSGFTVLHSFGPLAALFVNDTNPDGAWPRGALVQSRDGALYGAAAQGGPRGSGTVFNMSPEGTGFTVLHAFDPKEDMFRNSGGAHPVALTLDADGLIGVTMLGGEDGQGTLFKMGSDGKGFKTLHQFHETTYRDNVNGDGARPNAAPIFGRDGSLYGTANIGGKYGYGVIYRITTDGKRFDVLHHFQRKGAGFEANGVFPQGALTLGADGFLYGSARQGGRYDGGILFKMSQNGTGFTVLHTFSDPKVDSIDGSLPSATPVFGEDGRLYGLASTGGAGGMGIVFRVTPDGSKFFLLHDFGPPDTQSYNADGGFAQAGLTQGRDRNFYGITCGGGLNGNGTIFRLMLPQTK